MAENPQQFKDNDPSEDGQRMMQQATTGLGIPAGTSMMVWPKKPLGKAAPKAGKSGHSAPHNQQRAPKSTHRKGTRSSKPRYNKEVGLTWGFD